LLLPFLAVGCTLGPNYQAPAAPEVSSLTEKALPAQTAAAATQGGEAQRFEAARDIPGDWWAAFQSPEINALVTRALQANPDVAAAQATLREARQNLRAEQGTQLPQVSATASAERQRESLGAVGFGKGSETFSSINGSLGISYTLDTFGGIRRQVEQLGAQVAYQRYELEATDLTLTANVVSTAIATAALQAQVDTTKDIIRAYSDALSVTQQRFALGGVSKVDVLQQQAQRDAEAATLPGLQKQLAQSRNQLAVYLGRRPGDADLPSLDLAKLTLPREIPLSLPSKLVEQRPDIQASAALVHAATAQVGVATANLLPQISLSASYGRAGSSGANLFTPEGIVWTLAGNLAQPIFDGGTLRAKKSSAEAALDVAAAQYSSTVNVAFQNVADALVAIEHDAETLQAALQAEQTAQASLDVAQGQYRTGGGTYLNVLTAQQAEQSARLNLVTARAARFTDTVALFQALGGGWWNRQDVAQTAQCCGVAP
jgi:NodT family efflux transporter outer membrane factor (OMF) lipoprotein